MISVVEEKQAERSQTNKTQVGNRNVVYLVQ